MVNGGTGASSLAAGAVLLGDGTAPVVAAYVLPPAVQAAITQVGTLTSGVWSATPVASASIAPTLLNKTLAAPLVTGLGATITNSVMLTINASGALLTRNLSSAGINLGSETQGVVSVANGGTGATAFALNTVVLGGGGSSPLTSSGTLPAAVQTAITQLGTVTTGTWSATPVASAFVAATLSNKTVVNPVVGGLVVGGAGNSLVVTLTAPTNGTLQTRSLLTAGINLGSETAGVLGVGGGGLGTNDVPAPGAVPIGDGAVYRSAPLTAGAGIVVVNGAGSITIASGVLDWTFADVRKTGEDGGASFSDATVQRVLNTVRYSDGDDVTLADNMLTFKGGGKYRIVVSAPAYTVGTHKVLLFSETLREVLLVGTSEKTDLAATQTRSFLTYVGRIDKDHVLSVLHFTESEVRNGLGYPTSAGYDEVYTTVEVTRLS